MTTWVLLALAATAQEPKTLKFDKVVVRDPAVDNIDGATLLLPPGWKLEGGFVWMPNFSMGANLMLRITDPATGASVEALPSQQFNWPLQQMPGPLQPGSNWMGSVLLQPPADAVAFVDAVLVPGQLAHLRGQRPVKVEDLPKYAAEVAKSVPAGGRVVSTRLRYAYTINGQAWEELVTLTLTYAAPNGWTAMWWCGGTSMRAPAGKLDALVPVLSVPFQSLRVSLDWFAMLNHVRDLIRRGFQQELADQRRLGRLWTEHRENMRRQHQQAYDDRMAQQDRQNFAFRENIGGIETYKNPFESRAVELPLGYRGYWVNPQGQYVLSTDPSFDPNAGGTSDFRRLERHRP